MQSQELVIELKQEPFPHAIIRNFYTEEELSLIWKELDFYTSPSKFVDPMALGGAKDNLTGDALPIHYAISLDLEHENNRNNSDILNLNRKVFDPSITNILIKLSPLIWHLKYINCDSTKIKYYENGDYYKSHWDVARFTMLTYLYKKPKAFTGGDLYFEEFNYTIPIENNMLIFFTGCINHASTEIKMIDFVDQKYSGYGKYTITQFLDVKDA